MKRLIATSFILAALTATTGCTRDRAGEPVNNNADTTPSSVTGYEDTTSAGTAMPDTNDRGTVATDMSVSERSAAPARDEQLPSSAKTPNAINTPGSHSPDMGAQGTNTATRTTPSASDTGDGL